MAQIIKNSKPVEQVDHIKLWDLKTNTFSKMARAKYNKLSGQNKPIAIGNAPPPFFRRFYIVEDYPGQKLEMYHAVSMSQIECFTLSLFQEIQRRNPVENTPVYENGVKIKNTWSAWEQYLISRDEIDINAKQPEQKQDNDIAALVNAAVEKQLKSLGINIADLKEKATRQIIKEPEINDKEENSKDTELLPGEIDDKPKRGRRKKVEA